MAKEINNTGITKDKRFSKVEMTELQVDDNVSLSGDENLFELWKTVSTNSSDWAPT